MKFTRRNLFKSKLLPAFVGIVTGSRHAGTHQESQMVANDPAEQSLQGSSGPVDGTYSSLALLKAAPITNLSYKLNANSAIDGYFFYETANSPYVADDVNVVKLDSTDLSVGALVRQKASSIQVASGMTVQDALDVAANPEALLASTKSFPFGAQLRTADGFFYTVAASGAIDHHVTTAGGVKLYVNSTHLGINLKAFGVSGLDDDIDTGPAFRAAAAALGSTSGHFPPVSGGTIIIPKGDFPILTETRFLTNIVLRGQGPTSKLLVADGVKAFTWGRLDADGGRVDIIGGAHDLRVEGLTGSIGHVSQVYGTTNAGFGFTSTTTDIAGWLDSEGNNATNQGFETAGTYTPFEISGCDFYGLGRAIAVGGQYGLTVRNNKVRYCAVGIETVSVAPTTIDIKDNTIERCAIGVFAKFPSSFLRVDHNIIQANYAGCDIFMFNGPKDVEITRNYFEASPSNIVARADSGPPFVAERIYIEGNTGIKAYIRLGEMANWTFKRNWVNEISIQLFAGGVMKNVVIDSNVNGSKADPMDVSKVIIGSAAAATAHEIKWLGKYNNSDVEIATTAYFPLTKTRKRVYRVIASGAGPVAAFAINLPASACYGSFEVKGDRFGSGAPTKNARWVGAINRASGMVTATAEVVIASDTDIPVLGGVSLALPTPTATVTGVVNEAQTVTFNLLSGNAGGSSGLWLFEVEMTNSNMGIKFV